MTGIGLLKTLFKHQETPLIEQARGYALSAVRLDERPSHVYGYWIFAGRINAADCSVRLLCERAHTVIKLFVGVPGSGKSLAMQDTVRLLNRESKLGCVVIDRTNEWALLDKDGHENVRWRGDPPSITLVTPSSSDGEIRNALQVARDEGQTVVFQQVESDIVGEWVRRIGYLVYCDDEIDLTARVAGWHDNPLRAFVHTGRHLPNEEGYPSEVHILGACRRVQNIHTDLTELADEVFVFRSQGKNTFKRILDEGWCDDAAIDKIRTQPNLAYHCWRSDGTTIEGHLLPLKVPNDSLEKAR